MRKVVILALLLSIFNFQFSVSAQVASSDEMLKPRKVGREGMVSVLAADIAEGEYEIASESSSSMFRITKSLLSVKDGAMSVSVTMSGKSYTKLFLGTAQEASDASGVGEIAYTADESGSFCVKFFY